MAYGLFERQRLIPGSIDSGSQNTYLQEASNLPGRLQALFVQLYSRTEWYLAIHRGYLQTKPITYSALAQSLQCSVRTVKRQIRELVERGEVIVHVRFGAGGHQIGNIFTFPRLRDFLEEKSGHAIQPDGSGESAEEGQGGQADLLEQTRGDTDDTPKRQSSSKNKNAYLKIRNICEKEEFLALTGSIRSIAPIVAIIRKHRPSKDPDLIYRFFRELIGRPGFKLTSRFPNFLAFLGYFAKTCRLLGDKSVRKACEHGAAKIAPPPPPPPGDDEQAQFRRSLYREFGPNVYESWFAPCDVEILRDQGSVVISAPSRFLRDYISGRLALQVDRVAAGFGVRPQVTAR